jgi:hypothetical protein
MQTKVSYRRQGGYFTSFVVMYAHVMSQFCFKFIQKHSAPVFSALYNACGAFARYILQ